jgi:hypothetical protein
MKFKFKYTRPGRTKLCGFSQSEFKTFLRRNGFRVHREFFGLKCSEAERGGRRYRFRHWAEGGFLVDISCKLNDFDRWANSTDEAITFEEFKERMK